MGSYRMGVLFTRKFRFTEAGPPPDVAEIFRKYAEGGTHMTAEQLQLFLMEVEGDSGASSMADARWIVEHVMQKRHHITKFNRQTLTLEDFHHFLFSADLNPPIRNQVHQDMTAPLSQYFIYTGHNSYLTGNQLSSDSSDVPIIKALKRGVRAIELDLWPNSAKDRVLVYHGRTLTTPVELIKCLRSIKEHAFSVSPYPVIITLEDHLTSNLQAKVAQMLTQTFGERLFIPESDCLQEFPSPEELKYRIIISTKPPKEYLEPESIKSRSSSHKEKDSDEDSSRKVPLDLSANQEDSEKSYRYSSDKSQFDEDNEASDREMQPTGGLAYKRLIAIIAGKYKGRLNKALNVEEEKVRRLSLSEQVFERATSSHGTDVVRFTQKNILRIYPKLIRFNSSNFKPLIGWMHGAQMVAFNMQGYGKSLWLMHGMFRGNGGYGYVKKPDFLMKVGPDYQVFDPKSNISVKKTLKVKVYMGDGWHLDFKKTHFSLWSPPDFYARVSLCEDKQILVLVLKRAGLRIAMTSEYMKQVGIAGVPSDKIMKKTRTKANNWTPVWDEEFTFPLTVPELALLRVEVHDYNMPDKDDFAGQTCLPVPELRPGIHAVPLFDRKGDKYNSVRLLMRFEFV